MSFLDIDTILAEEERIPCTFKYDAYNLSHLDPTTEEESILPAASKVEMPLWMASHLLKYGHIDIEMPKHFGPKMRNELDSSSAVNLRDYSFYFFDVGLELVKLANDFDLLRTLRITFSGDRFKQLINSLANYQEDASAAEQSQSLTHSELLIFNEGQTAVNDILRWRSREGGLLSGSSMLRRQSTSPRGGGGGVSLDTGRIETTSKRSRV